MPDIPEERQFAVGLELRDAQAVGVGGRYRFLEGVAVPYDVWADIGPFVEQHAAGSFERSTRGAGKNLPLLLFHDNRKWPVGHAEKWTHDRGGLTGVWRLNDTNDAQTAAQLAELDRRLADHEANPDDVVPWTEVKTAALARIRK